MNGWKGRIRICVTGTRGTIQELGANLDEEALGEHVMVAPLLARPLIILRFSLQFLYSVAKAQARSKSVREA